MSSRRSPIFGDLLLSLAALNIPAKSPFSVIFSSSAEASGCDALVRRDPGGYSNAPLPVIDPAAALSWLTQE
jgi:hypothetical protein